MVGTTAAWHFWLAAGVFAATVASELVGQVIRGVAGSGAWGWLALVGAGGWVVGLAWRERVGVWRAWVCWAWVMGMSLLAMRLAQRNGFLFGRIEFAGVQPLLFARVPLSVPLLWWLIVGGAFLVVEGLWGEWRAGVSTLTALVATQMGLMILPLVGSLRGDWRWPAVGTGSSQAGGAFPGLPWAALAAWFVLGLALAFGLVIMGDNWSSNEARAQRKAWAPAAVLLALTIVCFGANIFGGLWLAVAFSTANAVLFGAAAMWNLYKDDRPQSSRLQ